MVKFIGRRCTLGIAKEATRGTAVNPSFWIPRSTVSFDEKIEKVRSEENFGNIQEGSDSYITSKHGEGDFEAEIRVDALGLILAGVFGAAPSSALAGGEAAVYEHTYTLQNTNQHQSLSVLQQDPIQAKMFTITMIESLKITVEAAGGPVKYVVGFKSREAEDWTTQTETYTSDSYKFLHNHLTLKVAAAVGDLAAASALSVKSFEIEISKNLMIDNVAGTVQPEDILNQQFTVTGTIKLNHEDNTFKNYDLNNTYRAMLINLQNPTTIGNAEKPELNIQMPRVSFSEWERDRALNEISTQTLQFQGNYDATNALAVISTCVLTNQTASY